MTAAGSRTRRNKPHRPAGRPPAAASLRLVWRYPLSSRAPAALGLLAGLGALLWGGAALTVEHRRRTRRAGPDPADDRGRGRRGHRGHPPSARSATLNAPPAAGCPGCGWPPSSRSPRPRSARWRPGPAPGSLCLSNTERPCLNGWRPPAGQGLARLGDHDRAERGAPRSASAGGIRDAYPPVVSARGACLLATSRPVPDGSEEHAITGSLGTRPAPGH